MTNTGSGCGTLAFIVGRLESLRVRKLQIHPACFWNSVGHPLGNRRRPNAEDLCYGVRSAESGDHANGLFISWFRIHGRMLGAPNLYVKARLTRGLLGSPT